MFVAPYDWNIGNMGDFVGPMPGNIYAQTNGMLPYRKIFITKIKMM